jgi:CDP-2,3-bis-(O-geranylgeranyl)-sn-glycerol synthase
MALGLDQIPEALLPLLITQPVHRLGLVEMLEISLVFLVLELLLSRILFVLRIRKQPY